MTKNVCTLRFRIIMFVLTACVMAFAFIHSSMPSEQSDNESETVLNIITYILKFFGVDVSLTDHLVRKLAHFIEYSVLGALLCSCAYSFDRKGFLRFLPYSLFVGIVTSLVDETIQLGTPGRSGQITDMWIDFSGVLLGTAVMFGVFALYVKLRKIK